MAQRLMLMMSLFQSCSDWADGFQTGEISRELQQDSFVDKFQRMATAWVIQFLSGATSFCIIRLCIHLDEQRENQDPYASLEDFIRIKRNLTKSFEPNEEVLDQACELLFSIGAQWRKCELAKLAHQRQEVDQCLLQLLQQQLTTHSWLHDTNTGMNSACGIFILNLRQALSVLLSQSPQLTEIHQQVTNLAAQVEQRLKWAAGANSSLLKVFLRIHVMIDFASYVKKNVSLQVMKEFTYLQNECLQRLQTLSSLATGLGSVSSAILHYETFRTKTQESLAADSTFIQVNYLPTCNEAN